MRAPGRQRSEDVSRSANKRRRAKNDSGDQARCQGGHGSRQCVIWLRRELGKVFSLRYVPALPPHGRTTPLPPLQRSELLDPCREAISRERCSILSEPECDGIALTYRFKREVIRVQPKQACQPYSVAGRHGLACRIAQKFGEYSKLVPNQSIGFAPDSDAAFL